MKIEVLVIMSFSILIAGILSVVRFRKIRSTYRPFIYLIWVACINEVVSYMLYRKGLYNVVNSNVYNLIESLLLVWLFINTGTFKRGNIFPYLLMGLFVIFWTIDNFVINKFGTQFNSYFIIAYSLPIVMLSINTINGLLVREKDLLKNPTFLICSGFIIFFTYRIVVEVFWVYGLQVSEGFNNHVYDILGLINLLCNLIYALAILWMQKRQVYTLQF